jgi:pSer/pThr/pTyr-binding forkhead associated (FHA) protein
MGAHALAGRAPEMDIHLQDTFVSSKHALFESTTAGLQVEDLLSTNGTQVNGADISGTHMLRPGDRVEVGDTVFQVEVR